MRRTVDIPDDVARGRAPDVLDFASRRGITTANYDSDDFARELCDIADRGI